ncbi:MAG: hypothetical protein ACF8AM_22775, partial [Rhodopirellula sp. JB055]
MEIILLADQSKTSDSSDRSLAESYQARVVQTAQELAGVEQATLFQPRSRPQEENLPNDANPERSLVAYGLIREDASNEVVGGAW